MAAATLGAAALKTAGFKLGGFGLGKVGFPTPSGIAGRVLGGPGRGSADVTHTGIGFRGGEQDNPVLQSYFLDIPDVTVQGRRSGARVFEQRQKPIDFAVNETRNRLRNLGLSDTLKQFNSILKTLTPNRSNESIPLQQDQLDLIADVERVISGTLRSSGLPEEQISEFNRQSQVRAFDFNKRSFVELTKQRTGPIQGATEGIEEGEFFLRGGTRGIASRLEPFQQKFFPVPKFRTAKRTLEKQFGEPGLDAPGFRGGNIFFEGREIQPGEIEETRRRLVKRPEQFQAFNELVTQAQRIRPAGGSLSLDIEKAEQTKGVPLRASDVAEAFGKGLSISPAETQLRTPVADIAGIASFVGQPALATTTQPVSISPSTSHLSAFRSEPLSRDKSFITQTRRQFA